MVFQGRPFFGADILAIGELAAADDWESGEGTSEQVDIVDASVDLLVNGFACGACRIGWDAGNGADGPLIDKPTTTLPREHHLLFTHVTGHFPNPPPDPTHDTKLPDLNNMSR